MTKAETHITANQPGHAGHAGHADHAARLEQAIALWRQSGTSRGANRGAIIKQPWYIIIGPPGAGKTTALQNAGLDLPLTPSTTSTTSTAPDNTSLYNWHITRQAVLIDTAGHCTMQNGTAPADKTSWDGLLALLRRTRGKPALNGVLVAISLADIASASATSLHAQASAINARLHELNTRLGHSLPVYALFTKADLLCGFAEFFDDLGADERAQIWGTTFPPAPAAPFAAPASTLMAAFQTLQERLEQRLINRLQHERSPDKRALIASFPAQFASLHAPLARFIQAMCATPAPYMRGVYFTCATQQGTPLDRLASPTAPAFKPAPPRLGVLQAGTGRSYFLARLLADVVFSEAMLTTTFTARRPFARAASLAAIFIVFFALLAGLLVSHANNARAIAQAASATAAYTSLAQTLPLNPVQDSNLPAILPALNQASALPFGPHDSAFHGQMGFGLSQRATLATASASLYRNALNYALLPRLLLQLEDAMRANAHHPDDLATATKLYLMLGSQAPLDKKLVTGWMRENWQQLYPGAAAKPVRAQLMAHLDALLSAPLPPITLNSALLAARPAGQQNP